MPTDPSNLRIVRFPDPVLQRKAKPIETITQEVREVALRMIELMRKAEGIGLAAPQVGLGWRLFVAHVPPSDERDPDADPTQAIHEPMVCINPKLTAYSRDLVPFEEGCLSLPRIVGEVRRPSQVTLAALDIEGAPFHIRGDGLLARCWQHEHDHLDGVLIIDRMTQPSRMKNKSAIEDLKAGARVL